MYSWSALLWLSSLWVSSWVTWTPLTFSPSWTQPQRAPDTPLLFPGESLHLWSQAQTRAFLGPARMLYRVLSLHYFILCSQILECLLSLPKLTSFFPQPTETATPCVDPPPLPSGLEISSRKKPRRVGGSFNQIPVLLCLLSNLWKQQSSCVLSSFLVAYSRMASPVTPSCPELEICSIFYDIFGWTGP